MRGDEALSAGNYNASLLRYQELALVGFWGDGGLWRRVQV